MQIEEGEFDPWTFRRHERATRPADDRKNGDAATVRIGSAANLDARPSKVRASASELPLAPMADATNLGKITRLTRKPNYRWIEDGDEPSNEELGIVPDRRWLLAYVLIAFALVAYATWAWWPF